MSFKNVTQCNRRDNPRKTKVSSAGSQSASRGIDLHRSDCDCPKRDSIPIRQSVHGLFRNIDQAISSMIHGKYIHGCGDAIGGVRDLPACSTICRVPSFYGTKSTDVWERRKRTKSRKPSGEESVRAIRAGDSAQRGACIVVSSVVLECVCRNEGSEGSNNKSDEEREEVHDNKHLTGVVRGLGMG